MSALWCDQLPIRKGFARRPLALTTKALGYYLGSLTHDPADVVLTTRRKPKFRYQIL